MLEFIDPEYRFSVINMCWLLHGIVNRAANIYIYIYTIINIINMACWFSIAANLGPLQALSALDFNLILWQLHSRRWTLQFGFLVIENAVSQIIGWDEKCSGWIWYLVSSLPVVSIWIAGHSSIVWNKAFVMDITIYTVSVSSLITNTACPLTWNMFLSNLDHTQLLKNHLLKNTIGHYIYVLAT